MSDRVALVTGAGSAEGIGFACARLLGKLGARLVLTSTTERIQQRRDELAAARVEAHGVVADLCDAAQAIALVQETLRRFGRLDILVNNAGMTSVSKPHEAGRLETLSNAAWQDAYFETIPVVELGDRRLELATSVLKLRRLLTDVLDA